MKKKIFLLVVFVAGFHFTISAQVGIKGGTKSVSPSEYKVGKPIFTFTLNGKEGGRIDSSEIVAWDSLIVSATSLPGKNILNYNINGYSCIIQLNKVARTFYVSGTTISSDIKDWAMRAHKGDLIIFYNINVSDEKGVRKNIDSGPVFRVL